MFNSLKKKLIVGMMIFTPVTMTSCSDGTMEVANAILEFILSMLGWNPSSEKVDEQEKGNNYTDEEVSGDLPSSVDLSRYFPPIGNQGQYGTCVAWSTGYALKTALDAKTNNYSSSQLKNTAYQCSAVDLWHNIPTSGKSPSCNGSNFEPALEALMSNGCASVSEVPFTNMKMKCDGVTGKTTSNKLNGYRVIAYSKKLSGSKDQGMNVGNIKYYLAKGYPILIGAQLGERFMSWNSSKVISSDTEDYNGQHAYHAMVVTGYDDSKKAFRVRNSWGESEWGDNGCIWVDYDFFLNQFMFGAWIAYNSASEAPSANSTSSARLKATSANDLAAHVYSDVENADGTRTLTYNIENVGSSNISSADDWSVVYMIFNAKNMNEKAILFHDAYTNKAKANGEYDGVAISAVQNFGTDVDLAAGQNVAKKLGGNKMQFTYSLPTEIDGYPLNGNYYMVLIANPFNSIEEKNFANNYCFISGYNAIPLTFENGKITNMPATLSDQRSIITSTNRNTYSGDELLEMLAFQYQSGRLKNSSSSKSSSNTLRNQKVLKQIIK